MPKLADFVNRLAHNQHGGIMGFVRCGSGGFEGPMLLEIFVKDGRLTCADLERSRRQPESMLDEEMGFRGRIVGLNGPLVKALDCGDMLIGLND
jgi:hypothetical protein